MVTHMSLVFSLLSVLLPHVELNPWQQQMAAKSQPVLLSLLQQMGAAATVAEDTMTSVSASWRAGTAVLQVCVCVCVSGSRLVAGGLHMRSYQFSVWHLTWREACSWHSPRSPHIYSVKGVHQLACPLLHTHSVKNAILCCLVCCMLLCRRPSVRCCQLPSSRSSTCGRTGPTAQQQHMSDHS